MEDLKKELQFVVEELNMLAIRTDDILKKVLEAEKTEAEKTEAEKTQDTNAVSTRPKKSKTEKPVKKSEPKKSQAKKPVPKKAEPKKSKSKKAEPKKPKPKKTEPKKAEIDRDGILKIIIDKKKQGASFETIAQYLEAQKIPTLSGKGKWRKQSVHKLYQQNK